MKKVLMDNEKEGVCTRSNIRLFDASTISEKSIHTP